MAGIKAVIFDGGGVLIDDPAPGLIGCCAKEFGVSEDDFASANGKFIEDFQTGSISQRRFMELIAGELDADVPASQSLWFDAFRSAYREKKEMFGLAKRLRAAGYRTALLTNTEKPVMGFFARQVDGLFDVYVFSCVEGTAKPHRRIYELTLDRLGAKAQETVFIDDRQDYIDGGKRAGLVTILFEGIEQLKNELARLSVRID